MSKRSVEYQAERLRRVKLRKEKRKDKRKTKYWLYGKPSESKCPYCGGQMSWCRSCEMWSRSCCEEYGTCQCS